MKRYFIYMVMVVAALFASCTTETTDAPQMTEVGDIEVAFSVSGNEVSMLNLSPVSHRIVVDVTLNNEDIYWNVEANKEWCQILEEEHRGSGSFTMVIDANSVFDDREIAEVTFTAGEYAVRKLVVNHRGNLFIVNQVYAAATKIAGSHTIMVQTEEGVEWSTDCDNWISAEKGASTTADGITTTALTLSWSANEGESRYGSIGLVDDQTGDVSAWLNIWQYGTEMTYDENNNLLLVAENPEPLELRVPVQTVEDVVVPSWVSYSLVENGDNTVSYMLQFENNPSDANVLRSTNLSLKMLSKSADIVLPIVMQEYYAAEGIITGAGLQLFAKTWNEGGSIAQWCIDDVPTIVGDIDMSAVENWTSIGTEANPWTGKFNGNNKKLKKLSASQPIFGFCKDAYLMSIAIDETSNFESTETYEKNLYLAALAGSIENTIVEFCSNGASVSLDASTQTAESETYVAALVGKADKSSKISNSTNTGAVDVKGSCVTVAGNSKFYVGGIAGYNAGIIEDSFNNASVSSGAMVNTSYVAGVAGYTSTSSILRANLNAGTVTFTTPLGNNQSLYAHVGGVAGRANGELSSNTNDGDITSTSGVQSIYVGGIAGSLADPNLKFSHNSQGNSSVLLSAGKNTTNYIGGLAGYVEAVVPIVMDFNSDSGTVGGTVAGKNLVYVATAVGSVGGYFGYCAGDVTLTAPKWTGVASYTMLNEPHTINEMNCGGLIGRIAGKLTISNAEIGVGSKVWTKYEATTSGAANNTIRMRGNIGGMVGKCEGEVSITNSVNNATVEWGHEVKSLAGATSNRQNSSACFVGGFVGQITNVKANIEACENKGRIYNHSYNNNAYSTALTMNCTGGIVGGYGAVAGANKTLNVKSCSNSTPIDAIRGFVAGIVGYAINATIDNCSYLNGRITDDQNCYMAGIIGGAAYSTIKDCTAITNLNGYNGGSCYLRAGGIVAWSMGATTIEKCKYFGDIATKTPEAAQRYGGVVGLADDENTVIKNCQYGGSILGVEIGSNNCKQYALGVDINFNTTTNDAQVGDVTYWNGK